VGGAASGRAHETGRCTVVATKGSATHALKALVRWIYRLHPDGNMRPSPAVLPAGPVGALIVSIVGVTGLSGLCSPHLQKSQLSPGCIVEPGRPGSRSLLRARGRIRAHPPPYLPRKTRGLAAYLHSYGVPGPLLCERSRQENEGVLLSVTTMTGLRKRDKVVVRCVWPRKTRGFCFQPLLRGVLQELRFLIAAPLRLAQENDGVCLLPTFLWAFRKSGPFPRASGDSATSPPTFG